MTDEMAIFADWMSNLNEKFTEIPLSQLAIPGSHDAMAYSLDVDSSVLEPKKLKSLDKMFSCCLRPIVKKWGTAQDKTVSEQLEAGVRYFDLRVAGKSESSDLFFYHGLYTIMTVKEGMTELATWLRQHTKEVVILAFSHFKEMSDSQHSDLTGFLKEHFKTKLCPKTPMPSLKACWGNGYQVVLSYDKSGVNDDPFLWPRIEYWWAENSDPKEVISYLNNQKLQGRPEGFFVAGLNLTFDGNDMLLYLMKSLKEKTMSAYPLLLDWVKEQHPGSDRENINIIAGDFVGVNSFVQDVIRLNSADNSS
ncbi:PI-PLC X domain-containing protein 1-like [Triplophysa rosa]|uniref:PI-PLC X domain-containing protein 1-like n=1 Tax=Triplophysa rosa TaxID=992332 RepID=A0A9W8C5I4_TRIRA|nr:PI-PLC X domain-containing protein 1-like [Triplophysa rosa]XP_057193604.1 PI-PLC X domain-containing protein 1-like [Triplophysa rosa]XP_057193606.1 PI-PLC X domain-containing protein 1-like [Triplophysa rosa]XP_057193607.1 PI-PLC X domain-containing protein 1-like [Triplophysa rosa]XP_057193608.1 PI-PLC X domain-containing protein 1-like [Triplophysa rosa]KAI7807762.1 putative PI-PLC X domain-containing protein 1-like [Triplophysa rosa]